MKSIIALLIAVSACALPTIYAASLYDLDGEDDPALLGPAAHLIGAKQLDQKERHTYAIRLRFSRGLTDVKAFKYCNGVRLSSEWILTTAECLMIPSYKYVQIASPDPFSFTNKYYELGDRNLTFAKLKYEIHGAYDNATKSNNLALIKSEFRFVPERDSLPKLPYLYKDRNEPYEKDPLIVSSYELKGTGSKEEKISTTLDLKIVSISECADLFAPSAKRDEFICASAVPGQGLTQDDIGSPLVHKSSSGRKTLIGIASTVGPYLPDKPQRVLFTTMQSHLTWISFWTHLPV